METEYIDLVSRIIAAEHTAQEIAREALRLASHKLPIKCKCVKKEELEGEE